MIITVNQTTVQAVVRYSRYLLLAAAAYFVFLTEGALSSGAACAGVGLLVAGLVAARAAGAAGHSEPMPTLPARVPGNGTKCFHGIRVVELATVVAAPSCSRTLAEHGAEVIKIEEPKGDMWRKFFLEYEDERGTNPGHSSCFESVNLSKYSVVCDLKNPEGIAKLKRILSDADVFITNVRPSGLKRLGLDFPSLQSEFPSLIVAQLTAWGLEGPGSNLAGYDIGAFWTATGMSASLHSEGHYSVYPIAAGDCITGAALLAGINTALCHRAKTGEGQHVTSSLMHTGMYCISHTLATTTAVDTPSYAKEAKRQPCSTSYGTRDSKRVVILGAGTEAATLKTLTAGFPDSSRLAKLSADGDRDDTEWVEALEVCFEHYTLKELLAKLQQLGVPHCEQPSVMEMADPTGDCRPLCGDGPLGSRCYTSGPAIGISDIPRLARNPLNLSCSPETENGADPICRAPLLGAHTASFDRQGWSPIKPEATLPRVSLHTPLATAGKGGLSGVRVVELSKHGLCASSACALLADAGASVVKLECSNNGGDSWRTRNPASFAQFNRGKKSSVVNLRDKEQLAAVFDLLKSSSVFVTNYHPSELDSLGLGHAVVRKRFPELVYAIVSPWGLANPEGPPGEKGAFFAYGGIASCMQKPEHQPPELPDQLGEVCMSFFLLSGITAGLFHRQRTREGQLVDCAMLRCATWMTNQTMIIGSRQPSGGVFMQLTNMFSMQE